jgi:hypothetical protein
LARRRLSLIGSELRLKMNKDIKIEYQFQDIMELRKNQNKEIIKKLDVGLKKFMKEFFKNNKDAYSVSFDQDWESNDEGGSYCYVTVNIWDKNGEELDSDKISDILNELPNDLRQEVGGQFHRNTKAKADYEKKYD